jgi:thioredoxin-related protein
LWATPEDLRDYQAKYKPSIPLTLDESGTLFRVFRVQNTPTVIVADAQGKIVRRVDSDDAGTIQPVIRSLR